MEIKDLSVLVVEDDSDLRDLLVNMLMRMKFGRVEGLKNGSLAFRKLDHADFDLLITDLEMPVMGGIELIKKVRTHQSMSEMPILVITSNAKEETVVEAAGLQVNGYIIKPISYKILVEKIVHIFT